VKDKSLTFKVLYVISVTAAVILLLFSTLKIIYRPTSTNYSTLYKLAERKELQNVRLTDKQISFSDTVGNKYIIYRVNSDDVTNKLYQYSIPYEIDAKSFSLTPYVILAGMVAVFSYVMKNRKVADKDDITRIKNKVNPTANSVVVIDKPSERKVTTFGEIYDFKKKDDTQSDTENDKDNDTSTPEEQEVKKPKRQLPKIKPKTQEQPAQKINPDFPNVTDIKISDSQLKEMYSKIKDEELDELVKEAEDAGVIERISDYPRKREFKETTQKPIEQTEQKESKFKRKFPTKVGQKRPTGITRPIAKGGKTLYEQANEQKTEE